MLCVGQVGTTVGLGGSDGFRVLALTDPAHPELKGTYVPMMGQVQRLELVGDRAYLVTGFGMGELEVLDLADPATPTRLGGATLMFDVMDLAVADNGLVLLATGWMDLQLFDTRQGADPTALPAYGGVPGVYAVEVRAQGEDLLGYLAGQNGLAIVQLNDPSHPQLVGQWEQAGINLRALALSGNRAYIANTQQLWAIDVTDPSSPSLIGETGLGAIGLGAMGDRVYALTGEGLVILQAGGSVPAPRLEYQLQAGALVLDWSNAGSGIWVLQHNNDLSDAQGWQAFPGSEQTTQWQPDLGAARQFFRLAPNPN